MKRISLFLLFTLLYASIEAQQSYKAGMISLTPYIPEDTELSVKSQKQLLTKLNQIITAGGMANEGFDNRFVITANIQEIELAETATTPMKVAIKLALTIYIGDGIDGTLFSSYTSEISGVGDSKEDACISAIRKLSPRKPELLSYIETGKQRIIQYYNTIYPNIIRTAKATAKNGQYDEAIGMLCTIPINSEFHEHAQNLIAEYGETSLEKYNQSLLIKAQSAWATSPNEYGAEKAKELIELMQMPSSPLLAKTQKLCEDISVRLKHISDKKWKLERDIHLTKIKNEHEHKMAKINAAVQIAKANAANRPKIIYHVHWW